MVTRDAGGYRTDLNQNLVNSARYFYARAIEAVVSAATVALDGNDRVVISELLQKVELAKDYFHGTPIAKQQLETAIGSRISFETISNDAREIQHQHFGLERVRKIKEEYGALLTKLK